ncbi:hypothetical protein BgiMline_022193 [Biomphalaria glabrata]|uniref:Uncharacterized protein LOC106061567 isoform X1 n=1 Tax=Biomphalaria glabrata TaxID=6526 RepID=A0A9W3B6L4_BIOGL|nr:uncharacterized protein LOC106061567 isoform X1 [Biomphalaria glabrata]XP_055895196.1 uncharacterized protein LOC106061567 isoform X1 [Biomphalaria glabrata]XP_055895197.1 uncharacterized protein LOC106061567 isoform X1 [Biomphalaria glabrata]KAI8756561.1 hypothetical protein BgiMline_010076 [Biomphalaria glabrata]
MQRSSSPDDSQSDPHEYEEGPKVMLFQTYIPKQYVPSNSSFIAGFRPINGTPSSAQDVIYSTSSEDNSNSSDLNINSSSTTQDYEQLSREFYRSYDPSIGLHTAAVLGGILVWLVIYVIYRTKVRKCVIRLFKKKCGVEDEEADSKKLSDSEEKDSSSLISPNMVRPFINPSIVIESSPPESSPQTPGTYDQFKQHGIHESYSPYPLQGNNDDGYIFQFPYTGHHGHNQYELYHQQFCQEAADLQQQQFLQKLPKSEIDIPSATAQWVQNMPLVARSHQDFAGLLLAMQSRCYLAMNKPCSCPLVCPRSPQLQPLLDFPSAWNNSLPVLSNSLSSQLLSAYETVTNNNKGHKDIKDIINERRKQMGKHKMKGLTSGHRDHIEYTKLEQQTFSPENSDPNQKLELVHNSSEANVKKKNSKTPPNLTIMIPDSKESIGLISHISQTRSPIPIPVTPTVMIQNSHPSCRRHTGCDSSSSVTSSSSTDYLSNGPRHRTIQGTIPSSHLLSPQCENRSRRRSNTSQFSWSKEDVQNFGEKNDLRRSGSFSPHPYHWQQCSFKKSGCDGHRGVEKGQSAKGHYGSCTDSDLISVVSTYTAPVSNAPRVNHKRTLSDYNKYYADLMGAVHSQGHSPQHKRSISADITYLMSQQREQISPTYSNGSNKNSLGTSSYSHSPSPHLLQVPDPNNLRPLTPDTRSPGNCQGLTVNNEQQTSNRQYVRSDTNISYFCGCPGQAGDENHIARRHSTYIPPVTGEVSLSSCADNSVRATSSFGSASSHNSSHYTHPQAASHHHRHSCQHHGPHQRPHDQERHHSTGMLAHDCCVAQTSLYSQTCPLGVQSNLSRSYSAAIMETKL